MVALRCRVRRSCLLASVLWQRWAWYCSIVWFSLLIGTALPSGKAASTSGRGHPASSAATGQHEGTNACVSQVYEQFAALTLTPSRTYKMTETVQALHHTRAGQKTYTCRGLWSCFGHLQGIAHIPGTTMYAVAGTSDWTVLQQANLHIFDQSGHVLQNILNIGRLARGTHVDGIQAVGPKKGLSYVRPARIRPKTMDYKAWRQQACESSGSQRGL
jgi:hypothetical protein